VDENARILFGQAPDLGRVRDRLRHAVGTGRACSVQVTLFSRALRFLAHGSAVEPDIMVSVSPPDEPQTSALRVRCADYERETPEVKHLATYKLLREVRAARTAGFDDVLFVDRTGLVSAGSTWNVCFHDGHQGVWPDAPALRGVTMQLLPDRHERGGCSGGIGTSPDDRPGQVYGSLRDELGHCRAATDRVGCPHPQARRRAVVDAARPVRHGAVATPLTCPSTGVVWSPSGSVSGHRWLTAPTVEETTKHNNLAIDVPERVLERDHVLVRVAHDELDVEHSPLADSFLTH